MRAIGIVLQTEVFQGAAKIELPPRVRGGGFGPGYYRRAARNSVASRLNPDYIVLPVRVEPDAVISGELFGRAASRLIRLFTPGPVIVSNIQRASLSFGKSEDCAFFL
jgi:hypothetical protein